MSDTEILAARAVKRTEFERRANEAVEKHGGLLMNGLLDVVEDLAPETEGLSQTLQDIRYAIELGYRIDKALALPGIAEVFDGPVATIAAGIAVAIWRHEISKQADAALRRGKAMARRDELLDLLRGAEQRGRTVRATHLEARLHRLNRRLERLGS